MNWGKDDDDEPAVPTVKVREVRVEQLADLKAAGCYIGECAAWSAAAHEVRVLASDVREGRVTGYIADLLEALEQRFAAKADIAAKIADRFR